jgi:hypothetical protein
LFVEFCRLCESVFPKGNIGTHCQHFRRVQFPTAGRKHNHSGTSRPVGAELPFYRLFQSHCGGRLFPNVSGGIICQKKFQPGKIEVGIEPRLGTIRRVVSPRFDNVSSRYLVANPFRLGI